MHIYIYIYIYLYIFFFFFFFFTNRICSVAQLCLTIGGPLDCNPPGFSAHGISQARILNRVAFSSSRDSSQPEDWTWVFFVSCIGRGSLKVGVTGEETRLLGKNWNKRPSRKQWWKHGERCCELKECGMRWMTLWKPTMSSCHAFSPPYTQEIC